MIEFEEPLVFRGISYRAPENFYQAMLFSDTETRSHIASLSPWDAKKYAALHRDNQRIDANVDKLGIMFDALSWKFQPGTKWHEELHATEGEVVLYANWQDAFWERRAKVEDGKIIPLPEGENWNGRILTVIRDKEMFDPDQIGRNWAVTAMWLTKMYVQKLHC